MSFRSDASPPVCCDPKVFCGQLDFSVSTEDVQALFSKYGTLRSCQVVMGPLTLALPSIHRPGRGCSPIMRGGLSNHHARRFEQPSCVEV